MRRADHEVARLNARAHVLRVAVAFWATLAASVVLHAAEPVRIQLKWYHQFQFAGYYAAASEGFFEEEGLAVEILEGRPIRAPLARVLAGEADYGVSDVDVLLERLRGQPFVVCAAVFQHSPYIIMSRADRGIRTPADLIGCTVMMSDDQGSAQLRAMLVREGIDPDLVTIIPHSWNLADLIEGRVDAMSAYATVEPFMMQARGVEPAMLRAVDYGVDFYGDTLFTTETESRERPERVAAVLRAVRKGWLHAFENSDQMIDHILAMEGVVERGITREQLQSEARAMRALVLPEFVEIGHMNPARWRHIAEVFFENDIVAPGFSLAGFIHEPAAPIDLRRYRWVAAAVVVVVLGAGAVLLWNVQIRRRVRERTAALQSEIAQRRKAEAKLREQAALLDVAHDAIVVRSLDHRITYWNRGSERLYGWTGAEAVGRGLKDFLLIDTTDFVDAERALSAQDKWSGEIQYTSKEGRLVTVVGSWTLLRDEDGRPTSILSIDTDVTERKQLEAQFLRSQRVESIGTLAGGIAHDLNNLLAPIVMGVDLLRDSISDESARMVVRNIERSAKRGSELVKQVLSFARGVEAARAAVNLRHVVRDTEAMAESTFPKNIRIESLIPQDLWLVTCDPTQLGQVLLNLCVNARDAMPGGGRIAITASNVTLDPQLAAMNQGVPPGPYVCVEVADTGMGIAKVILARIFDPFFTTKEPGQGTGLGLSTVLGIVRSHGGFVTVDSTVGQGSRFKVYFPAQTQEAVDALSVHPFVVPARGQGECVLVVDDETSILEITRQTLEAFGYRVLAAEDGAQAIALYAQHRTEVSVVITDMMMPVMDGPALIAALRGMDPAVRIIATSGFNGQDNPGRAKAAGVRAFLHKPYSADTMLTLLRRILSENVARPSD